MFMLTMGSGMALGFPDTCLTPGTPPVPVPYPNVAESIMAPASAMTVLGDCMPTLNELSSICISEGDEPGTLLGVVSHVITGATVWLVGSESVLAEGLPVHVITSYSIHYTKLYERAQTSLGRTVKLLPPSVFPSLT